MKRIVYTRHLKMRLKFRRISYKLPKEIYQKSKERYFDKETQLLVVIDKVKYKGKAREFVVVCRETQREVRLITIHPLKAHQRTGRIKSGRWKLL